MSLKHINDDGFYPRYEYKPYVNSHLNADAGKAVDTTMKVVSGADKTKKVVDKVISEVTTHSTDIDPISWILDAVNVVVSGVGALTKFIYQKKNEKINAKIKSYDVATKVISNKLEQKTQAKIEEADAIVEAQKKQTQKMIAIAGISIVGLAAVSYLVSQSQKD